MYTVDFYIDKFSQIADEKWTIRNFNVDDRCCALGHCGARDSAIHGTQLPNEAIILSMLFKSFDLDIAIVNDGIFNDFTEKTPKSRVLSALYYIKSQQEILAQEHRNHRLGVD